MHTLPDAPTPHHVAPGRVVFLSAARQVWGAEMSLLTLADGMAGAGLDTLVICPTGELAERAGAEGTHEVVAIEVTRPPDRARVVESMRLWRAYARIARPGDHLVLFSYYLMGLAPAFAPQLRRKGVRLCLDLHDTLGSRKALWSVQLAGRFFDSVIACSEFTASQLAGHPHVSALHRPVNPAALPGRQVSRASRTGRRRVSPMRVGIVGRISPEKGHGVLIEAMAGLGGNAVLVVRGGGDGWSKGHVRDVLDAGRRRLGGRFVVEGRVPPREALADLDAVVVGNPEEPMGRTVLEAQVSGVLAIVPDTGGSRELVEDGRTGLVYAHHDSADLARVLKKVRDDPASIARIVESADESVAEPSSYVREYLRFLSEPSPH